MRYLGFLLLALCAPLLAGTVGWRMDGSSRFPTAAPQASWSATERVVWATPLPAWSNACPVLVGERIFVCSEPDTLICLDRSGKILWQHANGYDELMTVDERAKWEGERQAAATQERANAGLRRTLNEKRKDLEKADTDAKAATNDAALQEKVTALKADVQAAEAQLAEGQKKLADFPLAAKWRVPGTHPTNGYSSDTPVCDGKFVYVCFGTGVVACYALDGTRQWIRLIEKPTHGWGHSGSPVLMGDTLVVQFINMFGLDAKTGETRWTMAHPHVWGTSAPIRVGKTDAFVTDCGEIVNVADGKTLAATGMQLEFGSPLVSGDTIYCVSGNKARAFQYAAQDDGTVKVTKLWETDVRNDRYYASPLLHDGLLYVVNQSGTLSVLDAAAGTLAYEQRLALGGTIYPSPVLAGNVILISSDSGKSVVLTPGREFKEAEKRPVLEPFKCTPICDGPRMYIRASSKLYCIGE